MAVKVNLPPGCSGFDCKDGTKYTANRLGGSVVLEDRHARAVNNGQFGEKGLVTAKGAESFGTKKSQVCPSCNRIWNAWNTHCRICGSETASA
jgi:hypothetical protein